jgi:hypothetical protein
MKRVKVLAAVLPAVGLAVPAAAAAATTTAAATVPTAHGKKVAYPRASHHQQIRLDALTSSTITSSATSPGAASVTLTSPASTGTGASPHMFFGCAPHLSIAGQSCMSVRGNGQFLSQVALKGWANKNGGIRTGFISYRDAKTHLDYPNFRTRTKSEPKGVPYSFTWNTECHLPDPGLLVGHVGGHSPRIGVRIHSGTTTGKACSLPSPS